MLDENVSFQRSRIVGEKRAQRTFKRFLSYVRASVSANVGTHIGRVGTKEAKESRLVFGQAHTGSGVLDYHFSFS
jgi:hypothetical protein